MSFSPPPCADGCKDPKGKPAIVQPRDQTETQHTFVCPRCGLEHIIHVNRLRAKPARGE